ncbi:unnamed protein product [Hanseniaspora opuntiae]
MNDIDIDDLLYQKLKTGQQNENNKQYKRDEISNSKDNGKYKSSNYKEKKRNNKKVNKLSLSDILGPSESENSIKHYEQVNKNNLSKQNSNNSLEIGSQISAIGEDIENDDTHYVHLDTNSASEEPPSTTIPYKYHTANENEEVISNLKSNFRAHDMIYFVVDTNFFIDNLDVIDFLNKIEIYFSNRHRTFLKICVVDTVLSELDHLKQQRSRHLGTTLDNDNSSNDLKMRAVKANRYIYDKVTTTSTSSITENQAFKIVSRANLKKEIIKHCKQLKIKYDFQNDYTDNNDDKILDASVKLQELLAYQNDLNFDFEFLKGNDTIKYSLMPSTSLVVLTNDKNFCIKLISSNLKTVSLPHEIDHHAKNLLIDAKILILKCMQQQIKALVVNWQSMVIVNLFEAFLQDTNLNEKILQSYDYLINQYSEISVDDLNYMKETCNLFAINNVSSSGIDDLLDEAPDMELIFRILNKSVIDFQNASCQTINNLGIYDINYDSVVKLIDLLFFSEADTLLDSFIENLIKFTKSGYVKEKISSEINALLNFDGFIYNMNKVGDCWKVYLSFLSNSNEFVSIYNFKFKLDVMWGEMRDLLRDLLELSEVSIEDLDLQQAFIKH